MVGVRRDGSLVVIECKLASHKNQQPLPALFQATDYLASFLAQKNFEKLARDAARRTEDFRRRGGLPAEFDVVEVSISRKSQAVVLAPRVYYERFKDYCSWKEFLRDFTTQTDSCSFGFKAVLSDFLTNVAPALDLNDLR